MIAARSNSWRTGSGAAEFQHLLNYHVTFSTRFAHR
jgi:hypothetical protein